MTLVLAQVGLTLSRVRALKLPNYFIKILIIYCYSYYFYVWPTKVHPLQKHESFWPTKERVLEMIVVRITGL